MNLLQYLIDSLRLADWPAWLTLIDGFEHRIESHLY